MGLISPFITCRPIQLPEYHEHTVIEEFLQRVAAFPQQVLNDIAQVLSGKAVWVICEENIMQELLHSSQPTVMLRLFEYPLSNLHMRFGIAP